MKWLSVKYLAKSLTMILAAVGQGLQNSRRYAVIDNDPTKLIIINPRGETWVNGEPSLTIPGWLENSSAAIAIPDSNYMVVHKSTFYSPPSRPDYENDVPTPEYNYKIDAAIVNLATQEHTPQELQLKIDKHRVNSTGLSFLRDEGDHYGYRIISQIGSLNSRQRPTAFLTAWIFNSNGLVALNLITINNISHYLLDKRVSTVETLLEKDSFLVSYGGSHQVIYMPPFSFEPENGQIKANLANGPLDFNDLPNDLGALPTDPDAMPFISYPVNFSLAPSLGGGGLICDNTTDELKGVLIGGGTVAATCILVNFDPLKSIEEGGCWVRPDCLDSEINYDPQLSYFSVNGLLISVNESLILVNGSLIEDDGSGIVQSMKYTVSAAPMWGYSTTVETTFYKSFGDFMQSLAAGFTHLTQGSESTRITPLVSNATEPGVDSTSSARTSFVSAVISTTESSQEPSQITELTSSSESLVENTQHLGQTAEVITSSQSASTKLHTTTQHTNFVTDLPSSQVTTTGIPSSSTTYNSINTTQTSQPSHSSSFGTTALLATSTNLTTELHPVFSSTATPPSSSIASSLQASTSNLSTSTSIGSLATTHSLSSSTAALQTSEVSGTTSNTPSRSTPSSTASSSSLQTNSHSSSTSSATFASSSAASQTSASSVSSNGPGSFSTTYNTTISGPTSAVASSPGPIVATSTQVSMSSSTSTSAIFTDAEVSSTNTASSGGSTSTTKTSLNPVPLKPESYSAQKASEGGLSTGSSVGVGMAALVAVALVGVLFRHYWVKRSTAYKGVNRMNEGNAECLELESMSMNHPPFPSRRRIPRPHLDANSEFITIVNRTSNI